MTIKKMFENPIFRIKIFKIQFLYLPSFDYM